MGDAPGGNRPRREPRLRRPRDEEVVAAATKVILEHETVASEKRFLALTLKELRRREPKAALSGGRLRRLALRGGLVTLHVRVRVDGPTPDLAACPVCGGELKRTANRTLTGTTTSVGYRCPRCPWWTGRDYRIPAGYSFAAKLARGRNAQTRFANPRRTL